MALSVEKVIPPKPHGLRVGERDSSNENQRVVAKKKKKKWLDSVQGDTTHVFHKEDKEVKSWACSGLATWKDWGNDIEPL